MRGEGVWNAPWSCRGVIVSAAIAGVITLVGVPGLAAGLTGDEALAIRNAIGGGIHAFHAGDFTRAYDDFSSAVEAGSTDPLAYYYRGLSALRLGRTDEAAADFATGAEREALDGGLRRVSRTLERVQGPDRITLEKYRQRARLAGLQQDQEAASRRYSAIDDAGSEVLRRRRPEGIRRGIVVPSGPSQGQAAGAGEGIEEVPSPPAVSQRAKPKPEAAPKNDSDDPFADEPADERSGPGTGKMQPRKGGAEKAEAEGDQEEEMAAEAEEKAAQ